MANVLLFHHILGLTPGVTAFADALRAAGHSVHTPDLFEGRTFASIDEGFAFVQTIGFGEAIARGERAAASLPADLVYMGMSMGVLPAQKLAQTRPGARGAMFLYACVPVSEFSERWPAQVPVQVHGMDADPFFAGEGDLDNAKTLVAQADDGMVYVYPGDQHFFADHTQAAYDADAAARLIERVLAFLAKA
jgi:dienelactone hydrolase